MNCLIQNPLMSHLMGCQQFQKSYSTSATMTSQVTSTPSGGSGGQAPPPPKNPSILEGQRGVPTALDKIFLRWSGQIKKNEPMPLSVAGEVIHRARSYARIRINIGFLFLAAVGCGIMIYTGKQAAKRGESMHKENLEWHRQIAEEYKKEQIAKGQQQ